MHVLPLAPVAALCCILCACATVAPTPASTASPDPDGVQCGANASAAKVYIEIGYSSGIPTATPDRCEVSSGTEIVWRGRVGDAVAFNLDFGDESPGLPVGMDGAYRSARQPQTRFPSSEQDGRQKVRITAKTVQSETSLAYGVITVQGAIDPIIIIRPR